jgi:hypothetical protein
MAKFGLIGPRAINLRQLGIVWDPIFLRRSIPHSADYPQQLLLDNRFVVQNRESSFEAGKRDKSGEEKRDRRRNGTGRILAYIIPVPFLLPASQDESELVVIQSQ